MKSKDLAAILEAYATLLTDVRSPSDTRGLKALAVLLTAAGTTTVPTLLDRLAKASPALGDSGPTMGETARALTPLIPLLTASAKPAIPTELNQLREYLAAHAYESLTAAARALATPTRATKAKRTRKPAAPPREAEIARFEAQLEAAKKSPEAFQQVIATLTGSSGLTGPELKQLAKRFTGKPGRTPADAIDNLRARHRQALTGAARLRATGGRSAG